MEEQQHKPHLILTCTLTENHFHGIRMGQAGDEECDWPPSPGRVFQSLINAAFAGLPMVLRDTMCQAEQALQWLECLPAPVVEAHAASPEHIKIRFQVALPLNNRKDTDLLRSGLQLAPLRRISGYDLCGRESTQLVIRYLWSLGEDGSPPLDALNELASRVSYFGRAEDRVEMAFTVAGEPPTMRENHTRWVPAFMGTCLRMGVPRQNSLVELKARHATSIPARTRKPNALSCLTLQPYRRHDTAGFPFPVRVSIVNLVCCEADSDGVVQAFDPLYSNKYRAWLRGNIIRVAKEEIHWSDPSLAMELIAGHVPDDTASRRPHLAIVPVPSLHKNGQADGQVRRFALLGYAAPEHEKAASEIYRTLFSSLDELIHDGKPTGLFIQTTAADKDKTWRQYADTSAVWTTVLPITFTTTKFDVSKSLTGNERHLKRQEELARLIRRALKAQGLAPAIVDHCSILVSATPFLPKTQRAEKYMTTKKSFRVHARLEFPCPVAGPVVIGDGRYSGMGLCFPA